MLTSEQGFTTAPFSSRADGSGTVDGGDGSLVLTRGWDRNHLTQVRRNESESDVRTRSYSSPPPLHASPLPPPSIMCGRVLVPTKGEAPPVLPSPPWIHPSNPIAAGWCLRSDWALLFVVVPPLPPS